MLDAVFAIPGDMHRRTGGFIYERRVLDGLRALGLRVDHLQLPDSFPDPSPTGIAETVRLLAAVPAEVPILLDGFIPGGIGAEGLAGIAAPLVPIIHHPLGLETGLAPACAEALIARERAALRHAARIVVPSPHTGRILADLLQIEAARIVVAPPGFDPVAAGGPALRPPLILSVGLLAPRKGHDVLVAALGRLCDLDWQARIIGPEHDARFAAGLRAQVAATGQGRRIAISGSVPCAELARAYAEASVFALATRYEGYGMVFGEAMKHGLPIVACRTGAVPETVAEAGVLVPPDDPEALAEALRALLADRATRDRLAEASMRRGRKLPGWGDTARLVAAALERARDAARC